MDTTELTDSEFHALFVRALSDDGASLRDEVAKEILRMPAGDGMNHLVDHVVRKILGVNPGLGLYGFSDQLEDMVWLIEEERIVVMPAMSVFAGNATGWIARFRCPHVAMSEPHRTMSMWFDGWVFGDTPAHAAARAVLLWALGVVRGAGS